jgi:hypothetical protein
MRGCWRIPRSSSAPRSFFSIQQRRVKTPSFLVLCRTGALVSLLAGDDCPGGAIEGQSTHIPLIITGTRERGVSFP